MKVITSFWERAKARSSFCDSQSFPQGTQMLLLFEQKDEAWGRLRGCFSFLLLSRELASPFSRTASLAWWLRRPPRERKIRGSNPACDGIFPGRVIPVTQKLALQWLPCQTPGIIGSALGLVDPVSVYCDWVRWKV